MVDRPLTAKQQRFVDAYDGNATAAARAAGYGGGESALATRGSELMRNRKVAAAIAAREARRSAAVIASRAERQEFWTQTVRDTDCAMQFRLKASELLGRSEADFIDTTRHQGHDGGALIPAELTDAELTERARG